VPTTMIPTTHNNAAYSRAPETVMLVILETLGVGMDQNGGRCQRPFECTPTAYLACATGQQRSELETRI
jgi:hypothetical protein